MFPVVLSVGPVVIRSFGLLLMLAFLASLFVIWKRVREEGLSEERSIDVFFLAAAAFVVFGRLGFVLSDLSFFQKDFGRIFLLLRYPGILPVWGLLAASVVTVLASRLSGISAAVLLDIFVLGVGLGSSFWYLGCFLDGCDKSSVWLPLIFSGLFLVFFSLMHLVIERIRRSSHLYELSRRAGWVSLCYLIFSAISFLISSYLTSRMLDRFSLVVLIFALGLFLFRYFDFLKGVRWLSFPAMFSHKLGAIWRTGGRIWKRDLGS